MKVLKHLMIILCLTIGVWAVWNLFSHQVRKVSYPSMPCVSVLTYNTHRMGEFKHAEQNRVIRYLQQMPADIICLQEVEVYHDAQYLTLKELRAALDMYPYTYFDFKIYNSRRQFGNVVFSKYPLLNKQTIQFDSRSSISSRCDVVVGDDTLRLVNNHLESNRLVSEDFQLDSMNWESTRATAHRLSHKMKIARVIRHGQATAVKQAIQASEYPVIAVGDFNSIPLSYVYQRLKWGMRDCFLQTSRGQLGWTLTRHHLGIRIDYILCSQDLQPLKTEVVRVNYSDHYPVIATIGWVPDSDNP